MSAARTDPRVEQLRAARRIRSFLIQVPYLLVLAGVVVAALLVMFDRWRRGSFVFGSAFLVGALLRAVIPTSRAGLLQIRGKLFDVATMAAIGGLMLWLATSIDSLGTD
ncbi:DUF3017 domain-containing protein [Gordonia sp. ABSL1-1]|uniref:DUF3017 domain-containing protein n=1 Tax=Gordonia sp. ABSL1-1 TaxID=3053923 RepID=UPI002572FDA7|nr:DUF3017 domain-containing protein [Gordonia sp. ABSL1-1]MDL9937181.1 DUF3017 domain-containing protein [Gordonia sp. ABSL1-1]